MSIGLRVAAIWHRCDFFLWGAVKDRCYADNPETIPALENNITTVLSEIGAEVVQNVINNWGDRMAYCKANERNRFSFLMRILLASQQQKS